MKSNIAVEEMKSKEEYRDYTLGLALFDAVPVLLFLLTGVTVFLISGSRIFLAGVIAQQPDQSFSYYASCRFWSHAPCGYRWDRF